MAELYLQDEQTVGRQAQPEDPPFIVAANMTAGWLYEIAGPFFWAALVMMFVLGGVAPR